MLNRIARIYEGAYFGRKGSSEVGPRIASPADDNVRPIAIIDQCE